MTVLADVVFESSFEVCNKVGGIHTVITSKIPVMKTYYDTYFLIGPLFDTLPSDFIEQEPPESFATVFSQLQEKGIVCKYGIWDTQGRPTTILINGSALGSELNTIKGLLWEKYGVDSLSAAYDFDEPLMWSWAVGQFVDLMSHQYIDKKIVGHFHEWLSGFSALYLNHVNSSVRSVFTTHATMLGRAASSRGEKLCAGINFNPEEKAKEIGVSEKFTTERACARTAHVFTTVSDLTACEAELILGKKPLVTPNGLALEYFPSFEDLSYRHTKNNRRLKDFVISHFLLQQSFDLSQTYFFCYGGRYEYYNKGMDMIINSLKRLNEQLKEEGSEKTVVMFFFIAMHNDGVVPSLLENKEKVNLLLGGLREKADVFVQRLLLNILVGEKSTVKILPQEELEKLREEFNYVKYSENPASLTHMFQNSNQDPLLNYIKEVGLTNNSDDRVKVVMMPAYLDGKDGLLNMTYYDALSGCHLGLFPSIYEPWGYTPLESVALGVPTVTSSTAGFGLFMRPKIMDDKPGLFIVDRCADDKTATDQLYDYINRYVHFTKEEQASSKLHAHTLSSFADWRQLITFYLDAHNTALK